jgi:hypothetical protein
MTTSFPFTDLQLAVINDLKTTDAPQGNYALRSQNGFCCLGRMCEVLGLPSKAVNTKHRTWIYTDPETLDSAGGSLPGDSWKQLNLRSAGGKFDPSKLPDADTLAAIFATHRTSELWSLNDQLRWSFKQIGEFMETYPELVFTNLDPEDVA